MGMKKREHWTKKYIPADACTEAVEWCKTQPSARKAWENCKRGDWMLWLLAKDVKQGSAKHRKIVLAACACARLAMKYVKPGEKRPLTAIETAEKWAKKVEGVTLEDVRSARTAAHAAAHIAAHAAHAAAVAADAWMEARDKARAQCADIVRGIFTFPRAKKITPFLLLPLGPVACRHRPLGGIIARRNPHP